MSIGRDGESVSERASKISEIAADLENISSMENSSMNRVVRTGGLITTSSDEINRAVRVSAAGVDRTLAISRAGGDNLSLLKKNHDALNAAADTVVKRLSVISGNAEKITELVNAINDVSRRTNLLSLNASVEAEKAGEAGLGFAVVARQVRKLADKASRASEDIEQIAKQLQSAVNSGVMEMDKFDSKMRQSSRIIIETANSLSRAIADIEAIGPKFEDIASRITILSDGAMKVSATMVDLGASSVRAVERISEFKSANSTLDSTAENLIGEVSLFKISDGKRGGK